MSGDFSESANVCGADRSESGPYLGGSRAIFWGVPLPKHFGEDLLEVILRRYENRSTIQTNNQPRKKGET